VPLRCYREEEPGEGMQQRSLYKEIAIGWRTCYQKFRAPEAIRIVVAGGTAGKFPRAGKLVYGGARQPDGDLSRFEESICQSH